MERICWNMDNKEGLLCEIAVTAGSRVWRLKHWLVGSRATPLFGWCLVFLVFFLGGVMRTEPCFILSFFLHFHIYFEHLSWIYCDFSDCTAQWTPNTENKHCGCQNSVHTLYSAAWANWKNLTSFLATRTEYTKQGKPWQGTWFFILMKKCQRMVSPLLYKLNAD